MPLDDDDNPTAGPLLVPESATSGGDPAAAENTAAAEAEEDNEGMIDFRLFTKTSNISAQMIRRGEKDFESHGTRAQQNALEQSRQAMVDVLSYTRVHNEKNPTVGWYFPDWWADWPDDSVEEEEEVQGQDGERKPPPVFARERVVLLQGRMSLNLGRAVIGLPKDRPGRGMDWLLPEEALFLVERGSLDLRLPTRTVEEMFPPDSAEAVGKSPAAGETSVEATEPADKDEEDDEYDNGIPLSLEAAYSLLIGNDGERGKISLKKFQVYSNLKRVGYNVLRAPRIVSKRKQEALIPVRTPPVSWFQWFSSLFRPATKPYGPLLQPGLYRSYIPIYRQLSLLPRHKPVSFSTQPLPSAIPSESESEEKERENPFTIHFHVWKSGGKWSKTRQPPPDFYTSVVDAQETDVPPLERILPLIDATPYTPFKPEWMGPGRMYNRLKTGHRNVLVAVVDHGIINYMRFAEGAFGEEELFGRFDTRGVVRGGKRGGGRGGGRGRGNGRGRDGRGGGGRGGRGGR